MANHQCEVAHSQQTMIGNNRKQCWSSHWRSGQKRSCFHLRLPSGLSPQRGQGQAPSPRGNRPHSHRCNRRALRGGLCHPPHSPLSGTCWLWRGPGDLSAPSRGWGGRGVDRGIRAGRSFPWTPGVKTSSPKDYEGNWGWSFSPKKTKGSSCTER